MQAAGIEDEWADILRDRNAFAETGIEQDGTRFLGRRATRGSIAAILRCAGARLQKTIRQIEQAEHEDTPPTDSYTTLSTTAGQALWAEV